MPEASSYQPAPIDQLQESAMVLDAVAALVGQAGDLGAVGRDGLGLLLARIARDVERATDAIRSQG